MALVVENVRKDYATRSGPLSVLAGINLTLQSGEAVAITGPSGSGKSTLLHILGTLDRPSVGNVRLDDTDPFILSDIELARFRNRRVGFVFQDHHLLPQLNVLENVMVPTLVGDTTKPADDELFARELIDRVGLSHRLRHRPAELSGGERQRVAVARAMVRRPTLLLADEPTGNLDRSSAHAVGELLLDLHRQQNAILVVVTHSSDLAAIFSKRLAMADGMLTT